MKCLECGKDLSGRWQQKYCSRHCALAHQRKERRVESEAKRRRVCVSCGKEFIMGHMSAKASRGEIKAGLYCSRKCRWEAQRKQIKPEPTKKRVWLCKICGKEMVSYAVYCSDGCRKEEARQRYHRNAETIRLKHREDYKPKEKTGRVCGMCGAGFVSAHRTESYCSDECKKQARAARKDARKRARKDGVYYEPVNPFKVFRRDKWRCQLCGKKLSPRNRGTIRDDAPELDHITPWAEGGEHSYRNTQCACRKCNQAKGSRTLGQLRLFG